MIVNAKRPRVGPFGPSRPLLQRRETPRDAFSKTSVPFYPFTFKDVCPLLLKEDIAEITQTVESVRTGFITSLELLKLELGKKALLHQLFAQKELEALVRIWDVLVDLQLATQGLRPIIEETSAEESAEDRYTRKYKAWAAAHNEFMNAIQKNQLFLDPGLHRMLVEILETSRKEASDFRSVVVTARESGHIDSIDGYDRAMKNMGRMVEHINRALESVRSKIVS